MRHRIDEFQSLLDDNLYILMDVFVVIVPLIDDVAYMHLGLLEKS